MTVVGQIRRFIAGYTLEDQESDLELDSLSHGQPVQLILMLDMLCRIHS